MRELDPARLIESEERLLCLIQAENASQLRAEGLVAKALNTPGADRLNDTSWPQITRTRMRGDSACQTETLALRFVTPTCRPDGITRKDYHTIYVVRTHYEPGSGVSEELMEDFSARDAELVRRLAGGLIMGRELGVLPHLAPNLTRIEASLLGTRQLQPLL